MKYEKKITIQEREERGREKKRSYHPDISCNVPSMLSLEIRYWNTSAKEKGYKKKTLVISIRF